MTDSIAGVALAGAFLILSHFGLSSTPLRDTLVKGLGKRGYLAFYSTVALAALVWLALAYGGAPYIGLWSPAPWQWFVPVLVVPFALVLLVGGLSAPNPTAVGQARAMAAEEPAQGVLRITRNPVMWAIGLWALAHIVPNGDVASLIFFGSLAVLALAGARLIDAKNARRHHLVWEHFAKATSNLPFGAVADGRQSLGRAVREVGWLRLAVALLLYVGLLHAHPILFGVSPLPPL